MQKLIPIIDNGHGSNTAGKRSPIWADGKQLFEYEFNRDVAKKLCRMLEEDGFEYRLLVPEIWDVSLETRCARANAINREVGGKAFLFSIHANAGGGTGFEAWTSVGQTKADPMATILFEEAQREFPGKKMRADYADGDPDKESQFYILKHTVCPAVLSENFFMDYEPDCRLIMTDYARERIARYHYNAIRRIAL